MPHGIVSASTLQSLRFGRFELRADQRVLLAYGAPVELGAPAFDLLVEFARRPHTLIAKEDLLSSVWAGLVVEENNLQVQVSTLRKVLGHGSVATIPGRGYRFTLPVASAQAESHGPSRASPADVVEELPHPGARTNLPSRLPSLYGRTADVAAIATLLRDHPVVTITGTGGIGKTRVAQAVAKQIAAEVPTAYPDGLWWVELAALADPSLVPSALAQAIGLKIAGEQATPAALLSHLSSRHTLLVLDNCEHLADAVTALIDTITSGAPRVSILVTSQETLRATDEQVYRLGGLAIPEVPDAERASSGAVELFVARAQAVDARFALTHANAAAVIEICKRLDGIPLAIELAAARLPLLGIEGLRARLHERFNLLTAGARVVLRRHQTLRATLEWSHALLTPDERAVFRRLGVFAGGWTLEAAQHVASDEHIDAWTVLDHLGALVDKSLVLAEGDPIPRYRMLETTRAYALERLAESAEMEPTLRRHAHAVVTVLVPFEDDDWRWRSTGAIVPAAKVELDNLRAALEWADGAHDAPLAIALAGVSYSVWWSCYLMAEGLARCLALRKHAEAGVSVSSAARFWLTIAKLGLYSVQRESYDAAKRAIALYRDLDDDRLLFESLTFAAAEGTRFATAAETGAHLEEAARLEQHDWPARQRAKLQFAWCFWFARQGRYEEALACAERQAAICREGGAETGALYATSNVTLMQALLDRPEQALAQSRAAIARLRVLDDDARAGHLYHSEMIALLMLDRLDEALVAARNAYPRLHHEGDHQRMMLPLALLNAMTGRVDVAARLAGAELAIQERTGENDGVATPALRRRLDPLLAGLGPDERARLAAEGAAMQDDDAFRLALGESS